MTLIPYVAEKLLRILFPPGRKSHDTLRPLHAYCRRDPAAGLGTLGIYYDKIAHMIGF